MDYYLLKGWGRRKTISLLMSQELHWNTAHAWIAQVCENYMSYILY